MEEAQRLTTRARGCLLAVALVWLGAGCGALRPAPLEVPPGHRVVLGRLDLSGFEVPEATILIVKEDGTFQDEVAVGPALSDFAVALPPGGYRVVRLRAQNDGRTPKNSVWELHLRFEVGPEAAVYIGTLRVVSVFGERLQVTVADDYDATLRALRARYPGLPPAVTRRLLRPA